MLYLVGNAGRLTADRLVDNSTSSALQDENETLHRCRGGRGQIVGAHASAFTNNADYHPHYGATIKATFPIK